MILKTETYQILINQDFNEFIELVNWDLYTSVFIVVDDNTQQHCLPLLQHKIPRPFKLIIIPAGESHKNLNSAQYIWKQLVEKQADRKSLVINLGGGVIGDMGGFCACTYMRGISFIQIPTTLLSQVDASVGGKLGIDFMSYKNMVGAFKDPQLVYINPIFLKTLPPRELRSGFAEVIKHALIKDESLWNFLTSQITDTSDEQIDWEKLIYEAVKIKLEIVKADPFEQSLRKVLNFGHSIGHAVESESFQSDLPMTHGEAIAVGMICEAYISFSKGHLSEATLEQIKRYIIHHFPKEALSSDDRIIQRMMGDKKNVAGEKRVAFPDKIGNCLFDLSVSNEEVSQSLNYYRKI